jgi:hypothetical protein
MRAQMETSGAAEPFIHYLKSVIVHHTPAVSAFGYGAPLPENWQDRFCGSEFPYNLYATFCACLLNIVAEDHQVRTGSTNRDRFTVERAGDASTRYSVVTVNYDTLLENIAEFFRTEYNGDVHFVRDSSAALNWEENTYLAKLHGSAEEGGIVPPTWNKILHPEILQTWQMAHKILSQATQIRVIGYSLPDTDTYVRYLLKAAALIAPHLKCIDVLCLDSGGHVRRRYDEFVTLPTYRFVNGSVTDYLGSLAGRRTGERMVYAELEEVHARYFGALAGRA